MYHDCNTNNDNGDKNSAFPMTATPFWDRTKAKKSPLVGYMSRHIVINIPFISH